MANTSCCGRAETGIHRHIHALHFYASQRYIGRTFALDVGLHLTRQSILTHPWPRMSPYPLLSARCKEASGQSDHNAADADVG